MNRYPYLQIKVSLQVTTNFYVCMCGQIHKILEQHSDKCLQLAVLEVQLYMTNHSKQVTLCS